MVNNVVTKLEELNLVDKFLFDETMEDKEAYQALVSIILENEIELLDKPQTEKELRVSPQLRQVRLDVVSMDREKRMYYTEMQKRDTDNLIRRSRYYQAQLDVSLLEPGSTDFNLLNDSCFILIAPFDIFGRGLYRYTFEGVCRECPDLKLKDGAVRIFINTRGTNPEDFSGEFLDFMEYITRTTDAVAEGSHSSKIKLIHNRVRKIKISEKMGGKYMQRWEEMAYARQDGKAEGEELKLIKMICKKLAKNKTPEEIAEDLEEEISTILPICELAREFAPEYDSEKLYEKYHMTKS
ncbi:MAG: Rpn family recombination-promoting nuclease/putative transposase [Lachnospiraceae bacterium]|nr:Rpn family recombination-promoting nuclease/putative transposase [Lachnospiraceae bacterium]